MHEITELTNPRPLKAKEEELLNFLLSKPFPGRDALRAQLKSVRVMTDCKDCPTIELAVDQTTGPVATVKARVPIEAEGFDSDGVRIHLLLHVVDGLLSELEIFREDVNPILNLPSPDSLNLVNYGFGQKS